MPKKNFETVGELQKWEFVKGTITRIIGTPSYHEEITYKRCNDLCDIRVHGVEYKNAPIFYHCGSSSVGRENGSIQGAASAFYVGEEVIVGHNLETHEVYVLCHVGDKRKCGIGVIIYGEYLNIPLGPVEVGWGEVYIRTKDRDSLNRYHDIWVTGICSWYSDYCVWDTSNPDIWYYESLYDDPPNQCSYIPKMNMWMFELPKHMTDVSSEFLLEVYAPGADEEGVPQEFGETDVTYRRAFPNMTSPTQEYVTPGIYKITVPYEVYTITETGHEIAIQTQPTIWAYDLTVSNTYNQSISFKTTGSPRIVAGFSMHLAKGLIRTKFETAAYSEPYQDDKGDWHCRSAGYRLGTWQDGGSSITYNMLPGLPGHTSFTATEFVPITTIETYIQNLEIPNIDEVADTEEYIHNLMELTASVSMTITGSTKTTSISAGGVT